MTTLMNEAHWGALEYEEYSPKQQQQQEQQQQQRQQHDYDVYAITIGDDTTKDDRTQNDEDWFDGNGKWYGSSTLGMLICGTGLEHSVYL